MNSAPTAPPPFPPLPPFMEGRPFGQDEQGRPIRHINGTTFETVFDHLRRTRSAAAYTELLAEVERRLNAAMPASHYQVTLPYLQKHGNYYSLEFGHFFRQICAELSGEPDFFYHAYAQAEYRAFAFLVRPLSLENAYALLPRIIAKVTDHDLRVIRVTPGQAGLEWRAAKVLPLLPAPLHPAFVHSYCRTFQGILTAIPRVHSNQPQARVQEHQCQTHGAAFCEWDVTWERPQRQGWFGWLKR